MPFSRRALLVLALVAVLPGAFFLTLGAVRNEADAQAVPLVTSDNVEIVASRPGTSAISGVFSRTAPFFYVSGQDSVTVFDVTDPRNPVMRGKLVNAVFENEAMTLGERIGPDGKIQRFVLVGNDLYNVTVNREEIVHFGSVGGQELIVVDVTDPDAPKIAGRTDTTTGTHTVACMNAACSIVYTSGNTGEFSIIDLTDLSKPKEIGTAKTSAGGGHHWNVDGAGIAFQAGSAGTTAFDISDPRNPKALNGTDANGQKNPYNDFIHHNVQRPNAAAFRPGQEYSVANGNVALITEEDYVDTDCETAGSFQTWAVPDLDGNRYRASNPDLKPSKGTMTPLDIIHAPAEAGGGLSTPQGGFCSAHWFDFHQSGVIAIGYYQQGLRLIDVRNPRDIKQTGFATGGASEVWDAYWAPQRDASGAVVPGRKTNLVYTVDAVRGVEVFEVKDLPADLPVTGDDGSRGAFPAEPQAAPGQPRSASRVVAPCAAPGSKFTRGNRVRRRGIRLRGLALARGGCRVRRVQVAVARRTGKRCRFLRADGRFTKRRRCARPVFLRASGTTRWRFSLNLRLPRGRYVAYSRAADTAGTIERWGGKRKVLRARVR
jgi:hypothetical protein